MNVSTGRVIALGFFDGVHTGHAALINMAIRRASELHMTPAVLSFDLHPDTLVAGSSMALINSTEDRIDILSRYFHIEDVILAHFDSDMMHMPWDTFVEDYLVRQLGAVHLVCGYDFHFGDRGTGNPELLQKKCTELGIGCDVIPQFQLDGVTVSSTYIRTLLQKGEMKEAARFLGHPHCLSGAVVKGFQLGRTIGIPTANLWIPDGVITPAFGVYATIVTLPDGSIRPAVTNIGTRPTVADTDSVTVEPWILDFDGDLYNQHIRIDFYDHLRGERKFPDLEALKQEILKNADETRRIVADCI